MTDLNGLYCNVEVTSHKVWAIGGAGSRGRRSETHVGPRLVIGCALAGDHSTRILKDFRTQTHTPFLRHVVHQISGNAVQRAFFP